MLSTKKPIFRWFLDQVENQIKLNKNQIKNDKLLEINYGNASSKLMGGIINIFKSTFSLSDFNTLF